MAKSLFILLLLTLYYTSYVNAGYEVVFPGTGTVLQAGELSNVTWNLNTDGPTEPLVDVRLVSGSPANLQEVFTICKGVDPAIKKCDFAVPLDSVTRIDYAITIGKSPDNYGYGSYFTINGTGLIPPNYGCPNMGGYNCEGDIPCCGTDGYCGKGADFCGTGCQPQFSVKGSCKAVTNTLAKGAAPKRRRIDYY
ncbi:hypothetical protein C1645_805916 [Glomus cerebriforme]|uniref:Chitin-binding type-1 domain-containing protein n=1 Tax=Glomus cerebriforme TaxID=658196 RepID=A0A397T213_9GLOM|nr:hypothetical protein C1645_805916 [Glomus cerebriforme]